MPIPLGPASSVGVRGRRLGARNGEEPNVKSSMKTTHAANDNQIDRTRTVWEPRIGHILTDDDARQIAANMTGFFSILAEWARLETPTPANDTEKTAPSVDEVVRHDR